MPDSGVAGCGVTPFVYPHATGFKGAHLHAERGQLLGKRFREASDSLFRCMVRRAAGPSQAAADR